MDLTTIVGAVLVILAGGCAGISAARELSRKARQAGEMCRVAERMRTEVCARHLPLPEMLRVLERDFPALFGGAGRAAEKLRDEAFDQIWSECVRALRLSPVLEQSLRRLGEALAAGDDPERAFDAALREMQDLHAALLAREKEASRLYVALGFSAGCIAAILLI